METPVLTPNGWSRMGDLKLNDNVISKDGKPTRVIGIFPQGKKEIWEISFSDGTKTEC
jgi:phosphate starvation-inducible PhoH-like protein